MIDELIDDCRAMTGDVGGWLSEQMEGEWGRRWVDETVL